MKPKSKFLTRVHAWCLPKFAENIPLGRRYLRFSPVFLHVISHPETAYGIEPLYGKWIWSPLGPYKDPRARERNDSIAVEDVKATNQNLIGIYQRLYSALPSDGIFITSFVSHNVEEKFLAKVVKWRHRHRTWEMLQVILDLSGWTGCKREHYPALHEVEHVVVLRKESP